MPRQHAYTVRIEDGREIGFGLLIRAADVYSVQFRGKDKNLIFRSTGETARPRAIPIAEGIIREHYAPKPATLKNVSWEDVSGQLQEHLKADNARPDTTHDYLDTINQVKKCAESPSLLTEALAQTWCNDYLTGTFTRKKAKDGEQVKEYKRSPRTLHARVRKLKAIWSKYLMKRLRLVNNNPWKNVDLPKLDAQPIRILSEQQVNNFFHWLETRWHGWELPTLFFELKAITACRLQDIASLKSSDLSIDGKHHKVQFSEGSTKARKARIAIIPDDLFKKLKAIAGKTWLWESYASLIGSYLKLRGVPTHRINAEFSPSRLVWWAMDEVDDFNKSRPDQPRIRSHDFCKRAITEAHKAGMDVDTVASGVGRNPNTVRSYYLALGQQRAVTAC